MTRLPNEYWLKYMLVFSNATLEQIVEMSRMYEMVPPTLQYLRELRNKLDETKPKPFRGDIAACRVWTRRQRLTSLATNSAPASQARDLLSDNKVRPILEALILADMPSADVTTYLHRIAGRSVTQEAVDMYRHYFWNRNLLSSAQWDEFLADHPDGKTLASCYKRGPEFALWKFGYRVELPKQEILQAILHESAMRFMELGEYQNGMKTATAAKFWAENVFKSIEALEKTGDSVKQVVDELRALSIKLGRREISSVEGKNRQLPKEPK